MELLRYYDAGGPEPPVPEDLRHLIDPLCNVRRFVCKHYPKGVIVDDTRSHTIRCVQIANGLNLNAELSDLCIRTLWIHDAPEAIAPVDLPLIMAHYDPTLLRAKVKGEDHFAKNHFLAADYKLYQKYGRASAYVKGLRGSKNVTSAALTAKVVDVTEGLITLHRSLSCYTEQVRPETCRRRMPRPDVLMLSLNKNRALIARLELLSDSVSALCIELVRESERTVRHLWLEKDRPFVPRAIKQFFS